MKKLAHDMNLDQLQMDMVVNVKEVAKFGLDFKSDGKCKLNTSHVIYQNCKMYSICSLLNINDIFHLYPSN
jgi:hypothetical protein